MYLIGLTKKDGSHVSFNRNFTESTISGLISDSNISIVYCNIFTEEPNWLKEVIEFGFTGYLDSNEAMVNYTSGSDTIYLESSRKNRSELEAEALKIKKEVQQLYSLTNIQAPSHLSIEMILGGDIKKPALIIRDGRRVIENF